ncbi:IS5 family transposase, partial [Bradyrhizobium sp. 30]|uniref:IS5 family transposase n=1 Tax=Bradyrhizobium sp. 30 TaxID=2782669 RepID=UPI001FFB469A
MRKGLFWLNDKQWAQIEPHLPTNQTGPAREDDRRIISGIIHMLQCGARWRDCPSDYGPYTTIYNRFNRWAKRGHWQAIFEALARCGKDRVALSIDSTSIKAHRSASGRSPVHTPPFSAARRAMRFDRGGVDRQSHSV